MDQMQPAADGPAPVAKKPTQRGVLHAWAFFVSLGCGAALIWAADGTRAFIAAGIFAISVSALLGVSALYHRGNWTHSVRMKLRRLDHSMIFLLIAGTYTPFALLVLDGTLSTVLLAVVWGVAVAGSIMELALADASKWIMAGICIGLGWVSIIAIPKIAGELGHVATAMLALGGIAYTAGAIIYAMQKPNPIPQVFGYHEVFHVLVVIAIALQYSVIAFYVVS